MIAGRAAGTLCGARPTGGGGGKVTEGRALEQPARIAAGRTYAAPSPTCLLSLHDPFDALPFPTLAFTRAFSPLLFPLPPLRLPFRAHLFSFAAPPLHPRAPLRSFFRTPALPDADAKAGKAGGLFGGGEGCLQRKETKTDDARRRSGTLRRGRAGGRADGKAGRGGGGGAPEDERLEAGSDGQMRLDVDRVASVRRDRRRAPLSLGPSSDPAPSSAREKPACPKGPGRPGGRACVFPGAKGDRGAKAIERGRGDGGETGGRRSPHPPRPRASPTSRPRQCLTMTGGRSLVASASAARRSARCTSVSTRRRWRIYEEKKGREGTSRGRRGEETTTAVPRPDAATRPHTRSPARFPHSPSRSLRTSPPRTPPALPPHLPCTLGPCPPSSAPGGASRPRASRRRAQPPTARVRAGDAPCRSSCEPARCWAARPSACGSAGPATARCRAGSRARPGGRA